MSAAKMAKLKPGQKVANVSNETSAISQSAKLSHGQRDTPDARIRASGPANELTERARRETDARAFLNHAEECAMQSAKYKALTDEDRWVLNWSVERLRPSFNELVKWFIEPPREGSAMYGFERLHLLMAACFYAGSRGTVAESAKVFFDHERTESPRKTLIEETTKKNRQVSKAIHEVAADKSIAIKAGQKYLGLHFLGPVNEKLRLQGLPDQSVRQLRKIAGLINRGQL